MLRHCIRATIAGLALAGIASLPAPVSAQEQPSVSFCQATAPPPVVTTLQGGAGATIRHRGRTVLIQDLFAADPRIRESRTITVVENFNGVQGLIATLMEDEFGRQVSYSFPAWLLDAYRGNTGAIIDDLQSGSLKDRVSPNRVGC